MSIAGLQGGVAGPVNGIVGLNNDIVGPIIGLVGPNALGRAGGIVAPWIVRSAPSYVASAVHFDGNASLGLTDQNAGLAADSPYGLVSVWCNGSDIFNAVPGPTAQLFQDNNNFNVNCEGTNSPPNIPILYLFDASNANHWAAGQQPGGPVIPSGWTNVLISWDMNWAAGARVATLYYNDVSQSYPPWQDVGVAFSVNYSDTEWRLLSSGDNIPIPADNSSMLGDFADFQMWCGIGHYVNLDVTANRRLFIDASGKPVNPSVAAAALGQQTVLLSGDATTFANNQGTGSATSVLAGTLTNAATHP